MRTRNKIIIGSIISIIISIIIICIIQYRTPIAMKITNIQWVYTINHDKYQTVHEEGWTVPSGGRVTYSYRKQRGEDCDTDEYCDRDGNCTTHRDCRQTYDTWYVYDIDRWITIDTFVNAGQDHSPEWPKCDIITPSPIRVGDERCGDRNTKYTISTQSLKDNKTYQKKVTFQEFNQLNKGELVSCKVVFGMLVIIQPLEGK